MNAISQIRSICNEKCFLAGFSVVIKDTRDLVDRELPIFVALAVALALCAMLLTMESAVLPLVLLANIGIAVIYNFGTNIFLGEISYLQKPLPLSCSWGSPWITRCFSTAAMRKNGKAMMIRAMPWSKLSLRHSAPFPAPA